MLIIRPPIGPVCLFCLFIFFLSKECMWVGREALSLVSVYKRAPTHRTQTAHPSESE